MVFLSSFFPPSLVLFFAGFEFAMILLPPNFEFSPFGHAIYIAIIAPNGRKRVDSVLVLGTKPLTHQGPAYCFHSNGRVLSFFLRDVELFNFRHEEQ